VPAVWDDPRVDWTSFALVVLRSTWDYAERRDEFVAWAEGIPRLANPLHVVRWNTDKRLYLTDLEQARVPVVETIFLRPGEQLEPQAEPFVVKPSVSAGGRSSGRFDPSDLESARALVAEIHAARRTAMVQPFLSDRERGETGIVYIAGTLTHAVERRVPLPDAASPRAGFYLDETIRPREATPDEREVAARAVAAVPHATDLLYARVDLLHRDDGAPLVLELELTEPSLYLSYAPGRAERLAAAVAQRVV
jgi:glutathione synthase/RimK-type ligase-like ATP-grasp enzyme